MNLLKLKWVCLKYWEARTFHLPVGHHVPPVSGHKLWSQKKVGIGWDIRILTQNFSEPGRWKLRNPRVKHMQQKNTVKSLKYSKGIMFQAKIIGFLGLSPILRQPDGPVVIDSYAFHHSLHKLLKSSSCVSSSAKHNDGSLKEVAVRSIWRFPKS